tara:strand:+ start:239 stop:1261 length:1023 start_codon:yes stop_codon:yes gene_type:complete
MSVLKVGAIQPNSGTKVNITGSTLLVTTASGHFSGSYEGDGSRLDGVNGLPFTGSGQISGSLLVTGSSALALRVTGSSAFTGSMFVSGTVSGSFIGDGSSLTGIDGYAVANSANNRVITSVDSENGNAEANMSFDGSTLSITGDATLTGTLTAATGTFVYQIFESSSTIITSGSNIFGDKQNDIQQITGSLKVTGSVSSSAGFSGSFVGDGSGLTDLAGGGPFAQTGSFFATSNDIQITGSLNATSVTETSALRYKKYVKPLRSQSDNVYKLRPVHFKWKDNNRGDIGLIAEEVGEVYPELVSTGVDGSAEGISYTKLTAVLIKTIQELSARIDKLENKN